MIQLGRQTWIIIGSVIALIIIALLVFYAYEVRAEDYWTNCDQAYRFCAIRPYHRDCSIWTQYGKPLISNHMQCPIP